jgi:DNA anti-recombination protein RmuC
MADKDIKEEVKKGYEFSVAGFKLKLNNTILAVAVPVITTVGGAMWGAFEFYQDYMDMRNKITKYVAPDLSEFDKRLSVIEENSQKTADYTRDIKNDLKDDIRRVESVAEQVERSSKQSQRETESEVRSIRNNINTTLEKNRDDMDKIKSSVDNKLDKVNRDVDHKLDKVQRDLDKKIQNALDNPLANK